MSENNGFTPIEKRLMQVLLDGNAHSRQELVGVMPDAESTRFNLYPHITHIRYKLRPQGQDVVGHRIGNQTWYRLIRMQASPYDGSR